MVSGQGVNTMNMCRGDRDNKTHWPMPCATVQKNGMSQCYGLSANIGAARLRAAVQRGVTVASTPTPARQRQQASS